MPLSEHEQRQLDQIERALYAEDPKFASTVRGGRLHRPSRRRRLQGIAVAVLGLVLLVVGMVVPVNLAGIPIISVVGFLVMFAGTVLLWFSGRQKSSSGEENQNPAGGEKGNAGGTDARGRGESKGEGSSFAQRMEERFRRRFDQ